MSEKEFASHPFIIAGLKILNSNYAALCHNYERLSGNSNPVDNRIRLPAGKNGTLVATDKTPVMVCCKDARNSKATN